MKRKKQGFSIIEILIAISILSIALLGIISGVSSGILAITGGENRTKAMIIARNMLNQFFIDRLRGLDINDEPVEEYPGFTYSREISRFEHVLFGPLDAKKVMITVDWEERGIKKNYKISYVYPQK